MLKLAVCNLLSRPMRTLLSLLGLTVAIVGMVGLFSVAEGLERMVTTTFSRVNGLLALQPGAPIPLFSRIPSSWKEEVEQVDGVKIVSAEIWQRANVINGKLIISPPRLLFGTHIPSRVRIGNGVYTDDIVAGRFLTADDEATLNTVISQQIAGEFNVGVGDPIKVNSVELIIVGIYETGSLLLDVAIILDIDQVRKMTRFDPESVCGLYIEPHEGEDSDEVAARIRRHFRGRELDHWNPLQMAVGGTLSAITNRPEEEDQTNQPTANRESDEKTGLFEIDESLPIEVRSVSEWASRFDRLTEDLDLLLAILTGIGVTIAVLSIVNTMLMSVSERIIEFGILKANGWSRRDVLKLVTFESAVIGVAGGVLGAFLGWIATLIVNATWPMKANLYASPGLLAFAVVFASLLGVLGGLYPAIWAMRMMPMDAIRRG
jgi:putative ABC transport system permease protein